jgi:hypothetical protein
MRDGMIREARMELGFFDTDKQLAALSAKGDPLETIDRLVFARLIPLALVVDLMKRR